MPRFVYHIDEGSVAALTQYYRRTIEPGSDILDICSSWVSHYPLEFKHTMRRISGTGMNAFELRANSQLTGASAGSTLLAFGLLRGRVVADNSGPWPRCPMPAAP